MTRARGRRSGLPCAAVLTLALLGLAVPGTTPVSAAVTADLVGTVPSAATPYVLDDGSGTASVQAIATVGNKVILGGTFGRVSDAGGPVRAASNLAIYSSATGLITVLPTVNGTVTSLLPGPKAGTVLVGGKFTRVNSTKVSNLALIRVSTGSVVTSFVAPTFNDAVTDLALVGDHLLVGGKFRTVGGDDPHVARLVVAHDRQGRQVDLDRLRRPPQLARHDAHRRQGGCGHHEDGPEPVGHPARRDRQLHDRRRPGPGPDGRDRPDPRQATGQQLGDHEPELDLQPQEVGQLGARRRRVPRRHLRRRGQHRGTQRGNLVRRCGPVRAQHQGTRRAADVVRLNRWGHDLVRGRR